MSEKKNRGCFKYGCIGCLSLTAVLVIGIFAIGLINMASDRQPRPEEREFSQALPLPLEAPLPPGVDAPDLPQTAAAPYRGAKPGRLKLDLSAGDFTIVPGPAGEPVRVIADFDSNSFRLEEEFEETEDSWTYKVHFGMRGGWLGALLRGGTNGSKNHVEIIVPRDVLMDIVGEISMGESEIDLGGLWLRTVDLEMGMGEHFLEFGEPLPYPMESLLIESSMGELELREIGNASPTRIQVNHSMGESVIDLEGPWRTNSEIDISFGMGQCNVWLPDSARIDLQRKRVSMGEVSGGIDSAANDALPANAPVLTVELSGSMGELDLHH